MAMVMNIAAKQSGANRVRLSAAALGRFLDLIPFRYPRFPAWLPGPGGATHPFAAYWGLKDYLGNLKRAHRKLNWRVIMKRRVSLEMLAEIVSAQEPVLIYGVGETGIPHVVVPIEKRGNKWLILDPGYPRKSNPREWTDQQLMKWWRNYSFIYPRGILIALEPSPLIG